MKSVGEAGALFAFIGWLTSRDAVAGPFSARHEATPAADLVEAFRISQGWKQPADGWADRLEPYPKEPGP